MHRAVLSAICLPFVWIARRERNPHLAADATQSGGREQRCNAGPRKSARAARCGETIGGVSHPFDPGPIEEPFASLARDYPGPEIYPPDRFRVEWGPIFHRGRLDGSARLLVLGQDPGQHESIARRILVGEAGQRVQGFMQRLGVSREYVMVNAYLYSVYGQPPKGSLDDVQPEIDRDRFRWLEALAVDTEVRAVVSFGGLARELWERWRRAPRRG